MGDQDPNDPVTKIPAPSDEKAAAEIDRLHRITGLPHKELVNKASVLYGYLHAELSGGGVIRLTRRDGRTFIIELR